MDVDVHVDMDVDKHNGVMSLDVGAHVIATGVNRTIRAFAATHACPVPNLSSGALHAPDADANHGIQVGSPLLHQIVSEVLGPSLPAELTLRL